MNNVLINVNVYVSELGPNGPPPSKRPKFKETFKQSITASVTVIREKWGKEAKILYQRTGALRARRRKRRSCRRRNRCLHRLLFRLIAPLLAGAD